MADEKDLKRMLDRWESAMADNPDLVDQINTQTRAEYQAKGLPVPNFELLHKDEASRMQAAAAVRQATENAINSSPGLKADLINEIGSGRLIGVKLGDKDQADAGSYNVKDKSLSIGAVEAWKASQKDNYGLPRHPEQHRELIGTLSHEIDHSQHRKDDLKPKQDFIDALSVKLQDGKPAHDHTQSVGDLLKARGTSESRAHLEYYNGIVQSLPADKRSEADIHAAIPQERRRDFFDANGHLNPALKTTAPDNPLLPQSPGNIEALRHSYFERPQFGPNHDQSYRTLEAAQVVKLILANDPAREVTINLKSLGIDYNAIQPELRDIQPPRAFFDKSQTPPVEMHTNQPLRAPNHHTSESQAPVASGASGQAFLGTCVPVEPPHPLYAQAMDRLHEMGSQAAGYGDSEQMRRMAGSLAALAQERNLRGIESVVPSLDGKGLIATWSNPGNPLDNDRVYMDKTAGANQPIEQSLQRLSASTSEREQRQELAAPQQNAPQIQGFSR